MKRTKLIVVASVLALTTAIGFTQLDSILKGAGIALIVDQLAPDMNKGINKLTSFKNTKEFSTKVVPIISIGDSAYAGAAQVMGPTKQVEKVKAVAQIEGAFFKRGVRLRGLIPVSTKDVVKDIKRVDGVGISGLVDIKL
ncbi:MAG: hypothetical protein WCO51_04750 [bacterium]|jgi:hypothetical protein